MSWSADIPEETASEPKTVLGHRWPWVRWGSVPPRRGSPRTRPMDPAAAERRLTS